MTIKAYAALTAGGKLEPFEYDPGELGVDQVEIDIGSCGICHSDLSWDGYINALRPNGKLHIVGAVPSVSATVFPLIIGQKSIGGSPLGSPATMIAFAARHGIGPVTETFPMSKVNDAMEKLRTGKPRFRWVLENDLD